jgi:hypothetical protein
MTVVFIEVKSWRFVMVQDPGIVAPLDWTFALDDFPQPHQNVATIVSIYGPCGSNSLCTMQ